LYTPVSQAFLGKVRGSVVFEIRTVGEPRSVLSTIRKAILAANPDAPIETSATMEERIAKQTKGESQIARLCSIFGSLALLLAATGLYGVLSYGVARRTNEIGIRMALGAGKGNVIGMILRETSVLVLIGLVAGVASAAACTRLIASQLYGLGKMDPATFLAAVGLLSTVALLAGYIPAARAARVNPTQALRHE
jgi:ABC-type lipoprotein release transport system permease subunit